MTGPTLLALIAIAFAIAIAMAIGVAAWHWLASAAGRRTGRSPPAPAAAFGPAATRRDEPVSPPLAGVEAPREDGSDDMARRLQEQARLLRSHALETWRLSHRIAASEAENVQLRSFEQERRRLFAALAAERASTARYRQIVVDIENDSPPPLLDSRHAPDDLKLIVGIGPVLERMLQQLGIGSYRQIARWSERDIDEFDRRLPEFPGRIRRDGWVNQARALHQSKHGVDAKGRR